MVPNFRQDNPVVRSYALIVVLLIISLVCMTVYAREGENGFLHSMQTGTSGAFGPARTVSGAISATEYSAFTAVSDATADASTLSELRQQNEELRQTVTQLEEYRQESQRLQQLLNFQDMYSLEGVTCTVLSRSTDSWNNVITIGKGSADGIRSGLPVVGPTGLVGQVVSVGKHSSEVRLLQDPQSGVAVMIQSNREEGILKGSLDDLLYLENIADDVEVETGDVIITSGLGGNFYRGIVVGTVVKVDKGKDSTTRRIVVEPNESTGPLQEVMVVTAMNSEGALAEKTKKDSSEGSDAESSTDADAATAEDASADTYVDESVYYDESAYYDDSAYYDESVYYDDTTAYANDGYTG